MNTLMIIVETMTNGYKDISLDILSLAAILCGIYVIISKNPILSVLFLIVLFTSIAIYLILIGNSFIGLSYILVYIGAVSILFLFILMLINVRISELLSDSSNSIPLGILVGLSYYYYVYNILPVGKTVSDSFYNVIYFVEKNNIFNIFYNSDNIFNNSGSLSCATSIQWDNSLWESSHITSIGNVIYTNYPVWLIITSIILLLAMVGSICLVVKDKK